MTTHLIVTEGVPIDGERTLRVEHPQGGFAVWIEDRGEWLQAYGRQILGAPAAIVEYLAQGWRQVRDGAELRAYLDREGERPEPFIVLDGLGRQVADHDTHADAIADLLIMERER